MISIQDLYRFFIMIKNLLRKIIPLTRKFKNKLNVKFEELILYPGATRDTFEDVYSYGTITITYHDLFLAVNTDNVVAVNFISDNTQLLTEPHRLWNIYDKACEKCNSEILEIFCKNIHLSNAKYYLLNNLLCYKEKHTDPKIKSVIKTLFEIRLNDETHDYKLLSSALSRNNLEFLSLIYENEIFDYQIYNYLGVINNVNTFELTMSKDIHFVNNSNTELVDKTKLYQKIINNRFIHRNYDMINYFINQHIPTNILLELLVTISIYHVKGSEIFDVIIKKIYENVNDNDNVNEIKNGILDNKLLIYACESGNFDLVQYLVINGCNVNESDEKALITAIGKKNIQIIEFLIQHGAKIQEYDVFKCIIEQRKHYKLYKNGMGLKLLQMSVNAGADFHRNNEEALYYSVTNGLIDYVRYLISVGASVHKIPDLLRIACFETSKISIVQMLVKAGMNANSINKKELYKQAYFYKNTREMIKIYNYIVSKQNRLKRTINCFIYNETCLVDLTAIRPGEKYLCCTSNVKHYIRYKYAYSIKENSCHYCRQQMDDNVYLNRVLCIT